MRLIIFDCDGTLVDSQKNIMNAVNIAWNNVGLNPPHLAQVLQIVGLSIDDSVKVLEPNATDEVHKQLVHEFYQAFKEIHQTDMVEEELYPNVHETLEKLNTDDNFMAVLTGKSKNGLIKTFEQSGIGKYFVATKTADCGPGKPNPQTMNELITELGVDKSDVVMVGDTTHDIFTAKNAGVKSIGVSFGYHSVDELNSAGADIIIDDFAELPNAIYKLLGE